MKSLVTLTDEEIDFALKIAHRRNGEARKNLHPDGNVMDSITIDEQGAVAEYAAAKGLNEKWIGIYFDYAKWIQLRNAVNDLEHFEVRSTKYYPNGKLILHQKDHDNIPYVLVLSENKYKHHLAGWCFGREGKIEKYWADVGYGRPCYYVPQSDLRDISELKRQV